MRVRTLSCLILMTVGLGACSSAPGGTQGTWGSQFGASTSGVAEDEASTAIAVLVNNEFGQSLERSDYKAVAEAQKRALRARANGVAVSWQNEETGRSGQVRPGPVYQVNDTSCREFTHEMILNGAALTSRGTACRQEDGSWKTLS
ncbi:RT0821/Lpp0805 family surface protein [Roseibium polysiphoniae]|uniref:Surface antigen domain-containing protein n=1 Tax=Roseibium polysiphoniae TaxID=2571221 RepID=A0ABR9C4U1_9HYPH|nr:RT0821/Lpp0805 family surface protein [Roseibium polysiphoniae]MBD8874876.1 hypothetical protein [Roseibium polysiphoniae]